MFFGLVANTEATAPSETLAEEVAFEDAYYDYDIDMEDIEIEMEYETIKKRVQSKFKDIKDRKDKMTQQVKANFDERRNLIKRKIKTTPFMRFRDKVSFVLGITALVHMFYFLGRWPHTYYNSGQLLATIFLLTWRFVTYKQAKYHYYMFDYCYIGNIVVWIYIYVYPDSLAWQRIAFTAANGPLLYSVGTMRNSLVFHSIDKLTSLYIHIVPPITMWNNVWYSVPETGKWASSDPN